MMTNIVKIYTEEILARGWVQVNLQHHTTMRFNFYTVLYLKSSNNKVKMWNNLQQRYTAKIHAITNVCSKETNTRPQSYC